MGGRHEHELYGSLVSIRLWSVLSVSSGSVIWLYYILLCTDLVHKYQYFMHDLHHEQLPMRTTKRILT